ncbi:hypothetical protein N7447_001168 [Penicillium robsamsonii]|uniref:uncharacterized protein n=1 Tax=Penicillium robsamsonii TaxID=1792511 RepID=UPI0025477C25|nr:uncharacterized protein N7447_001168 [Penicillium robsamsonii]KAJ5835142.1 hypothetical protein N7447_001168 [Penicillium robsamsonii]
MLSMHTSFFTHSDLNDEIRERESRRSDVPSLGIRGSVIRASTSSASTGASTDDASVDSPDWNGEKSPSFDRDQEQVKGFSHFDPTQLDHIMEIPKVEELEELDDDLLSIKQADVESGAPVPVPKKRGRPRKHPLPVPGGQAKITKGRSKTGCITCRRRKKKCDETKPACQNCQKNAVVCEGYPPKEIWKSGRQRLADVARSQSLTAVPRSLPLLIDGIETDVDRRFLDHFVYGFSRVLTLINDDSNPFKEILLPMATQHRGLMHSLMCLSGSHLSGLDPEPKLKERKYFHFHHAIQDLKDNINASSSAKSPDDDEQLLVEDPIIASTIALSLNTICEGETNGEYRPHMDAARYLLLSQQPRNEKFRQFIVEFFQYHDVSNSLTSLDRRPNLLHNGLHMPNFVPGVTAGMFVGVFDGLFNYISQITQLRDRIRERFNEGYEPAVDYQTLSEAVSVDMAIRTWETSHEPDTPNWCLAQLYRQSTWVYLYRTIRPSRPSDKIAQVVDDGLNYLDQLPQDASAFSIVLMPLFLLGCSAFLPEQRERITQGFENLKSYSNLRNIEPAFKVVSRVWEIMDTQMQNSWDWEKIIRDMNMDFLIT